MMFKMGLIYIPKLWKFVFQKVFQPQYNWVIKERQNDPFNGGKDPLEHLLLLQDPKAFS